MHDDRELAEERIRRTVRDRIRPAIHGARQRFDVTAWHLPGEPVPVDDARAAVADGAFAPFEIGGRWGKPWGTTWFRLQAAVPGEWAGETVEARVDFAAGVGPGFQSEGLIYATAGGGPIRGIHPLHQYVPVELLADADGRVDVLVEAAANPIVVLSQQPTPLGDPATAGDDLQYRLNAAELAVRHDDVYHLELDLQIAVGLMRELSTDDPRRYELLRSIDAALDVLDPHRLPATAGAARDRLAGVLARPAGDHVHRLSAVGHAHIDSAWLWPLRETRRKCARTFTNQLALMDEYPEHRFVCSQAAQYDWIEHDQPELFERIRSRVADGRFVPVGSMWVEADANLPSGESLARQLVWGKRYFADTFGVETTEVWLPDVFGYSAALPQLMAHAGCRSFLTQKLSWNKTNPFPHHSFWWEGLDGTRVFTHFPPADTYSGDVKVSELRFAVSNFRDKGRASRSMYLYGHGDGGGGPTREMLERARRVGDLDGLPRVTIEAPDEFFARAIDDYPDAPVWRGELYFEMHRGTYTSQAQTKWGNRRGELALRELEVWTALDPAPPLAGLERLWKELLLHQFHDIIPGSAIAWVHDDTEAAHAELLAECGQLISHALAIQPPGSGEWVAANAGPFGFAGVLGPGVVDGAGGPVWAAAPSHGIGMTSTELPAGVEPVGLLRAETAGTGARAHTLDNGLVRATIGGDGTLASLVDRRADRECLAAPANVLQLFPDHPNTYDAWDIEAHTLALDPKLLTDVDSIEVVDDTTMRAAVEVRRSFGASTITQTYVLRAGSARLDIETDVDWHEDEKLLKAAFPFDVRADDARYDIQYGHVRRPTHRNTSWDDARFEVCGHFWADLAEPDFGVALLNDGRYGHDCLESTMRLSLLRAPNYPDPDADRGHHRFTYSVLAHGPGLADVIAESWALNLPPRLVTGAPRPSVAAVDHPGVVITAVKAADDGSGDLVVRAHEAFGGRVRASLTTAERYATVTPCDLLERPTSDPVPVDADVHHLELRPFQLVTLRFTR
ncbi:MAG: glycoside hydrolase family 38 C-terminal domain-containing protein [Acidimicrobiales bacterium]|nr:glycoside hydrolase family 38 C-terminal domain-containing protein [Acidimicrobiales bacterium]